MREEQLATTERGKEKRERTAEPRGAWVRSQQCSTSSLLALDIWKWSHRIYPCRRCCRRARMAPTTSLPASTGGLAVAAAAPRGSWSRSRTRSSASWSSSIATARGSRRRARARKMHFASASARRIGELIVVCVEVTQDAGQQRLYQTILWWYLRQRLMTFKVGGVRFRTVMLTSPVAIRCSSIHHTGGS